MTHIAISSFRRFIAVSIVLGIFTAVAQAQSDEPEAHLSIDNPAELSQAETQRIYEALMERLDKGFASARLDILTSYQDWEKFNTAPYISATHGQRFVNNYANAMAQNYATLKPGEKLPAGSVLAKDSITITDEGRVFPGAMFVMEKLADGTSPATADWRYIMVMPDGSLFGDTIGDRPRAVTYCHTCHEQVAERDYTFFVPEGYIRSE